MIQYPEHKSVVPSVGTAIAAFGSSSKFVSASGKFVLSFFGLGSKHSFYFEALASYLHQIQVSLPCELQVPSLVREQCLIAAGLIHA